MGTGHTACREQQGPVPPAGTKVIQGNLDDLRQRPGNQPCNECFVLHQRQKIHSDVSSNGRSSSPATCFTLSSAASRSLPQCAASIWPRSNNLIDSSSWFWSPSKAETISSSSARASS